MLRANVWPQPSSTSKHFITMRAGIRFLYLLHILYFCSFRHCLHFFFFSQLRGRQISKLNRKTVMRTIIHSDQIMCEQVPQSWLAEFCVIKPFWSYGTSCGYATGMHEERLCHSLDNGTHFCQQLWPPSPHHFFFASERHASSFNNEKHEKTNVLCPGYENGWMSVFSLIEVIPGKEHI